LPCGVCGGAHGCKNENGNFDLLRAKPKSFQSDKKNLLKNKRRQPVNQQEGPCCVDGAGWGDESQDWRVGGKDRIKYCRRNDTKAGKGTAGQLANLRLGIGSPQKQA